MLRRTRGPAAVPGEGPLTFENPYIHLGTVTVHVRRLREKIEANPTEPQHVVTVWGVAYKFEP